MVIFMRQPIVKYLQASALAAITCVSSAHAVEITCPDSIDLKPVTVINVPSGWLSLHRVTTLWVQGALITAGPPSERTDLKPDIRMKKGGGASFHWKFDKSENDQGLWLSCGYGDTLVLLSQKLPPGLSQCTATDAQIDAKGVQTVHVMCQ